MTYFMSTGTQNLRVHNQSLNGTLSTTSDGTTLWRYRNECIVIIWLLLGRITVLRT